MLEILACKNLVSLRNEVRCLCPRKVVTCLPVEILCDLACEVDLGLDEVTAETVESLRIFALLLKFLSCLVVEVLEVAVSEKLLRSYVVALVAVESVEV